MFRRDSDCYFQRGSVHVSRERVGFCFQRESVRVYERFRLLFRVESVQVSEEFQATVFK